MGNLDFNASRSFCICTWSCVDLIVRYIKQSSANKRTCVPGSITLGRSFMNNKNKRGPIPVPWGTPDFTSAESDVLPSTTTCRLRWLLTVEQLLHWSDWICTGWAAQIKAKTKFRFGNIVPKQWTLSGFSTPVLTQCTKTITRLVDNKTYCIWIKCLNVCHIFKRVLA